MSRVDVLEPIAQRLPLRVGVGIAKETVLGQRPFSRQSYRVIASYPTSDKSFRTVKSFRINPLFVAKALL
jgi:hypothetical protein